jgi:glycosyltransferase involved in cell wall biosynthesis
VNRIKVIALIEAHVMTGPAKNILRFAADCRDRVDFTVVTFVRSSGNASSAALNGQFLSGARSLDVPVEIISETGRFDVSVGASLRQICERLKPNIVQTHAVKSHLILSFFRKRTFTWIAFHHGYTYEDLKMRIYNQFDRRSLRASDYVVTVCNEFARQLINRGVRRDRIAVAPNSVRHDFIRADTTLSKETRQKLSISNDELVVLSIGRLSSEKGHRYLIDAISKINIRAPQLKVKLLIAGHGPCEANLREQIELLGLTEHVRMLGYCSDIKPLFLIADLFVLPSLSEGSPNVLLESMAAGVPIVATHVGGVPELVDDKKSAMLVPPAKADVLANSIYELLIDRSRARNLATVASERVRLMFSPEKYDERILDIYARAVHGELHRND